MTQVGGILGWSLLLGLPGYAPTLSAQTKILSLGDSITAGAGNLHSYRYELWKDLIDSGMDFDLVGSTTANTPWGATATYPDYLGQVFDADHEGHYGWNTTNILQGLPAGNHLASWLPGYGVDVALVHLGTNDTVSYTHLTLPTMYTV